MKAACLPNRHKVQVTQQLGMSQHACPKCGGAPPVVVGGATAESIQKRLYCGQSVTEFQAGSVPQARPDTRAEQCLLAAAADRR
ncbi:hypothetical protein WJX82_009794 [Trebouxia sp. C0006]